MLRWILIAVFALSVAIGLLFVGQSVWPALFDPAADPKRAEPPAFVGSVRAPERLLFNGGDGEGWNFDGPWKAAKQSLQIGGKEKASARLAEALMAPFRLEFDFYESGRPPVFLLLAAPGRDNQLKISKVELNLGNYAYPRWHHVAIDGTLANAHLSLIVEIKPLRDGFGLSSTRSFIQPAEKPGPVEVRFEAEAGSVLYLRNVILKPKTAWPPTPPSR